MKKVWGSDFVESFFSKMPVLSIIDQNAVIMFLWTAEISHNLQQGLFDVKTLK